MQPRQIWLKTMLRITKSPRHAVMKVLDVHKSTMSLYISGDRKIPDAHISALCRFFYFYTIEKLQQQKPKLDHMHDDHALRWFYTLYSNESTFFEDTITYCLRGRASERLQAVLSTRKKAACMQTSDLKHRQ